MDSLPGEAPAWTKTRKGKIKDLLLLPFPIFLATTSANSYLGRKFHKLWTFGWSFLGLIGTGWENPIKTSLELRRSAHVLPGYMVLGTSSGVYLGCQIGPRLVPVNCLQGRGPTRYAIAPTPCMLSWGSYSLLSFLYSSTPSSGASNKICFTSLHVSFFSVRYSDNSKDQSKV